MDCLVAAKTAETESPSLGLFALLPGELRDQIYKLLSTGTTAGAYAWKSGIDINILCTNSAIYLEAVDHLYNNLRVVPLYGPNIPLDALCRVRHLTLEIRYATVNRGDCEVAIGSTRDHLRYSDHKALALRRSEHLRSLQIELCNMSQRKRGPKLLRSLAVKAYIARLLRPYAALSRAVRVEIVGFEALDFAEDFAPVREELAGTDISTEDLCEFDQRVYRWSDYQ